MSQKMNQRIGNKIRGLQRAPESKKKIWLIGASALTMSLVLILWFAYLNFTLPSLNNEERKDGSPKNESFFEIFGRGLRSIGIETQKNLDNLKERWAALENGLKTGLEKKNEFSLEVKEQKFSPSETETINPTKLP